MAERFDDAVPPAFARSEIDEQDLVVGVVDNFGQLSAALQQVGRGELALKDAVLQMIAPVPQRFEDLAESFGIADVIGDDVRVSHRVGSKGVQKPPVTLTLRRTRWVRNAMRFAFEDLQLANWPSSMDYPTHTRPVSCLVLQTGR